MLNLRREIIEKGQFPYGRRKVQYQSLGEEGMPGIRDMSHRYSVMGIESFDGGRVLDIGCSIGAVCINSIKIGASECVGVDINKNTIDVGSKYLLSKGYKGIRLFTCDINKGVEALSKVIGKSKFDFVFALSIIKHVGKEPLFDIIRSYTGKSCWFEGHNRQKREAVEKLLCDNINDGRIEFLGYTTDRGKRPNFKISFG